MTQRPHVSRETAARVARDVISAGAPWLTALELDQLALLVGLVCVTPVGVTAIRDPAEAAARHVLDALAGLPAVDAARRARSRTSAAAEACLASSWRWCGQPVRRT